MFSTLRTACIAACFALALLPATAASSAETTCAPEQFAELVDQTGEFMRTFARDKRPVLLEKFQALAKRQGWPPETAEDRGYRFLMNDATAEFDKRAKQLLLELDQIDGNTDTDASCTKLERLKAVTLELRVVTEAKFTYLIKQIDQRLDKGAPAARGQEQVARAPNAPAPTERTLPTERAAPRQPQETPERPGPWRTETTTAAQQPRPPLPEAPAIPMPNEPAVMTYSADDIREAGRGLFGNISANLASVIQYVFESYGEPNGYILGTEGGGALLAGLSYGSGTLNTKMSSTPIKVYWQSPTVGYDLGAQGSRVMFLVYNLREPEDIFRRYAGIGGSAYVIGGAGVTYHQRGHVVLAPIRTGLGLRVGANIGYLKFTPRISINPF